MHDSGYGYGYHLHRGHGLALRHHLEESILGLCLAKKYRLAYNGSCLNGGHCFDFATIECAGQLWKIKISRTTSSATYPLLAVEW